jgi:hypothetical protein
MFIIVKGIKINVTIIIAVLVLGGAMAENLPALLGGLYLLFAGMVNRE